MGNRHSKQIKPRYASAKELTVYGYIHQSQRELNIALFPTVIIEQCMNYIIEPIMIDYFENGEGGHKISNTLELREYNPSGSRVRRETKWATCKIIIDPNKNVIATWTLKINSMKDCNGRVGKSGRIAIGFGDQQDDCFFQINPLGVCSIISHYENYYNLETLYDQGAFIGTDLKGHGYEQGDTYRIILDTKDMIIKCACNDNMEHIIASVPSGKRKKKTPKNRNEWKLYVHVIRGCSMTVTNFDIVYVY